MTPNTSLEPTPTGRAAWPFPGQLVHCPVQGQAALPVVAAQLERTKKMTEHDQRPPVGIAHVVLYTDRMEESAQFMRTIGMRPIFDGPQVSVYEMRGSTHLILMMKDRIVGGDAPFDLMVDDLHATHQHFTALGLAPSPIEARPAIDHEVFTVCEPAGHVITFFSSHASGKPI